ncbi:MAG: cobalamin biosynthesis protein, partial [Candidatus Electrothrix sp. AUS1_2]|nr:cobalamin biosynthesis protein [Candidatus Electrothrix sp. AUS1_2]
MSFFSVLLLACLLDALLGDPRRFPHPVRLIGRFALVAESFTRKLPLSAYNSGSLAVLMILCATGGTVSTLLFLLSRTPQPVFLFGAAFILYTTIAARDLIHHARQVVDALALDIESARKRVGMIVGRDTDQRDAAGIVRACVDDTGGVQLVR